MMKVELTSDQQKLLIAIVKEVPVKVKEADQFQALIKALENADS